MWYSIIISIIVICIAHYVISKLKEPTRDPDISFQTKKTMELINELRASKIEIKISTQDNVKND
jgi:hypothetical protein